MKLPGVLGVSTNYYENKNLQKVKRRLKEAGVETNVFESAIPFSEFKLNDQGPDPLCRYRIIKQARFCAGLYE